MHGKAEKERNDSAYLPVAAAIPPHSRRRRRRFFAAAQQSASFVTHVGPVLQVIASQQIYLSSFHLKRTSNGVRVDRESKGNLQWDTRLDMNVVYADL